MAIALVGISHRTAGLEMLERTASVVESLRPAGESAVVLTCNRAELWLAGASAPDTVAHELAARSGLTADALLPHLYTLTGMDAVRHAMRVAAGLDSLIVGEVQILGQLGRALQRAQRDGTAGPLLTHLFLAAVRAGRRARSETEISRHTASVSHAAARVALEQVPDPAATHALVVGTGEAAELAARALRDHGVEEIALTGRTAEHAQALSARIGATALPWSELRDAISAADVVVSATSAPDPVIRTDDVEPRRGRPLALVDLAVPHDVDPAAGRLEGVRRYDLDDLGSVIDAGLARRQAAVPAVEAIVDDEAERFHHWLESRKVVPVITELRERVVRVAHAEALAALGHLGDECDVEDTADRLAQRIATKVLHEPVVRLKARAAIDGAATHVATLRHLFALEEGDAA